MSVLIPTMIGKHHLKLDMPGEFSNKVLQKCLTTTAGTSDRGRKGRSDHPAGYQDRKRAEGYCLLYY